jgi:hypothetical protein
MGTEIYPPLTPAQRSEGILSLEETGMHGKRYTNKKMRNILPPNTARFSVFI